jgi:hypothetical protein
MLPDANSHMRMTKPAADPLGPSSSSSPSTTTTTPARAHHPLTIDAPDPAKRTPTHPSTPSSESPGLRKLPAAAMPTPESEMFLAKKPKVAPTFNGVDYEDNVAFKGAQDAIIREQWVKSMMARLVREEMGKCYRREGVNHLEKCGALRGTFERRECGSCRCRGVG